MNSRDVGGCGGGGNDGLGMFRRIFGGSDSGVALSLSAGPITPLINSHLSAPRNI